MQRIQRYSQGEAGCLLAACLPACRLLAQPVADALLSALPPSPSPSTHPPRVAGSLFKRSVLDMIAEELLSSSKDGGAEAGGCPIRRGGAPIITDPQVRRGGGSVEDTRAACAALLLAAVARGSTARPLMTLHRPLFYAGLRHGVPVRAPVHD